MNNQLKINFYRIKRKGWIKSLRNGPTGIGFTFEELLGKKEDHLFFPDFKDIEIKTYRVFSKKKLHLLTITPDGDYLFPIERIVNSLGYPDKDLPEYKVFNMSFNSNNYTKINKNTFGIIKVDYKNKKVKFIIERGLFTRQLNISWSFDILKERLNLKLKKLAIIEAYNKFDKNEEYFLYSKLKYYEIKNFDSFIDAINQGIIEISFQIGIFKSGNKIGQRHDRGTSFSINIENIEALYEKKYES